MSVLKSDFSGILKNNTILFMPSCILVEMVTEVYARVAALAPSRMAENAFPEILDLLGRLTGNFKSAAESIENANLRFFGGDWRDDCLRVRILYLNLTSRLWILSDALASAERDLFRQTIDAMHLEWVALVGALERREHENRHCRADAGHCRHFRSVHPAYWQQIMARTILSLDAQAAERGPGTFLMLLCFSRIRSQIVNEIARIKKQASSSTPFRVEDILCLSTEYMPITCPKCMMTTEKFRRADPLDSFRRDAPRKGEHAVSLEEIPAGSAAMANSWRGCGETVNLTRGKEGIGALIAAER